MLIHKIYPIFKLEQCTEYLKSNITSCADRGTEMWWKIRFLTQYIYFSPEIWVLELGLVYYKSFLTTTTQKKDAEYSVCF